MFVLAKAAELNHKAVLSLVRFLRAFFNNTQDLGFGKQMILQFPSLAFNAVVLFSVFSATCNNEEGYNQDLAGQWKYRTS